jgi:hypothetical protein
MSFPVALSARVCRALAITALLIVVFALPGKALAANGAVAVDDIDMDPVGACKVESWLSAASNRDRIGVAQSGCVFDFGRPIDITAGFQRARAGGEWSTAGGMKLRTPIVEGGVGKVGFLFSAAFGYDFTADQLSFVLVNIPATYQPSENLKINFNLGLLYDRPNEVNWGTWGAGFDWSVNNLISIIGEVYGQFGHNVADAPHLDDPRAQLALRFKPNENLDFDVIYGRNITGENAHWITVGLNVRFNAFGERTAEARTTTPPYRK